MFAEFAAPVPPDSSPQKITHHVTSGRGKPAILHLNMAAPFSWTSTSFGLDLILGALRSAAEREEEQEERGEEREKGD